MSLYYVIPLAISWKYFVIINCQGYWFNSGFLERGYSSMVIEHGFLWLQFFLYKYIYIYISLIYIYIYTYLIKFSPFSTLTFLRTEIDVSCLVLAFVSFLSKCVFCGAFHIALHPLPIDSIFWLGKEPGNEVGFLTSLFSHANTGIPCTATLMKYIDKRK